MPIDLLYQGNAGLGQGANANIPVSIPNDLKVVNDTARDIMLVDNERNMKIFQQKVADRDNLTDMILKDQVPRGDILPEYDGYYKAASKKVQDAFDSWGGNPNDIKGYGNYKNAVKDLKDVSAHALTNTTEIQKLRQQQAKESLPERKAKIGEYIDGQMKQDFWNPVNPYQQLHDFNIDDITSGVNKFSKVSQDPKNPLLQYDESYVDFDNILQTKRNQFLNDADAADSMQQFYTKLQQYSQPQLKKALDAMDGQIDKYNNERGFKEGEKGFVPHVQRAELNGSTVLKEPITDFSAKYALANQEQFSTKTPKFNKAMADYKNKQDKLSVDWYNAKTKRLLEGLKGRQLDLMDDDAKNYSQTWDNILGNVKFPAATDWNTRVENQGVFSIDASNLPEGAQYLNGIDAKGQPIRLIPKDAKEILDPTGKKVTGYEGGYYKTDFFVPKGAMLKDRNGNLVKMDKDYQLTPDELYKTYQKSHFKGTMEDFIKQKFGNKELDYQLEGKNGKANRVSSYIAQKALGNKVTKKGQASPFTDDEIDLMGGVDDSGDETTPTDNN